eukprot:454644-Prymnesium_polylepis.1
MGDLPLFCATRAARRFDEVTRPPRPPPTRKEPPLRRKPRRPVSSQMCERVPHASHHGSLLAKPRVR